MQAGSIFHVLSRSSHKSKRPVRSIGYVEVIAAVEAIYEGNIFSRTAAAIFDTEVSLFIVLHYKYLFTFLSTLRNSIAKSVRADVNFIRYEFERRSLPVLSGYPENRT